MWRRGRGFGMDGYGVEGGRVVFGMRAWRCEYVDVREDLETGRKRGGR